MTIGARLRQISWGVLLLVTVGAVLALGVFPLRDYLTQRAELATATADLAHIEAVNTDLERRIGDLETDSEIERLARERYSLVYPGEEAYAVLPPPSLAADFPGVWPFAR